MQTFCCQYKCHSNFYGFISPKPDQTGPGSKESQKAPAAGCLQSSRWQLAAHRRAKARMRLNLEASSEQRWLLDLTRTRAAQQPWLHTRHAGTFNAIKSNTGSVTRRQQSAIFPAFWPEREISAARPLRSAAEETAYPKAELCTVFAF